MRTTVVLLSSTLLSCLNHSDVVHAKSRASSVAAIGNSGGRSRRPPLDVVVSDSSRERRGESSRIPWTGSLPSSNHHRPLAVASFPRGGQRGRLEEDDDADDWYNSRGSPQQGGGGGGGEYPLDDRYSDPNRQDRQGGGYNDDYYYEDRGYYDDRGGPSREGGGGAGMSRFQVPDIIKTGNRKIGLPLLGIGGVLTILGVSLFFNKTLMRLGNLFFVAGVPMTIGPGRTAGYFFQPKKARATGCLALGIFLVFVGWPVLGIVLEAFGLLNLFGNMFPVAMMMLKSMPVIGPLLRGEGTSAGRGGTSRRGNDRYSGDDDDDDYYYGGGGAGGGGGGYDRGYYDEAGRDQDDYNQKYY